MYKSSQSSFCQTQCGKSSDYVLNKSGFGCPNGSIELTFKQKNSRSRFQYLGTPQNPQNQARYQYSAEFTSVFQ